jgi:hypothetical protein
VTLHLAHERSDLWKIGASANNVYDFQSIAHERVKVSESRSIAFGFRRFGALPRPFAPKKH